MPAACTKCKVSITPTVPGLKCLVCNTFSHIKCTEITKAQYDVIKSTEGIEWKCSDCRKINVSKDPNGTCNCCELIPQLKEIISDTAKSLESLKVQLSEAKKLTDVNFEEIIHEVNDRQNRKASLIIYGFTEQSVRLAASEKTAKDKSCITEFLTSYGLDDSIISMDFKCNRLGRLDVSRPHPRPLKLRFDNAQHAQTLFHKLKSNRTQIQSDEQFRNIKVSMDRTPRQIAYFRRIKEELNQRIANGEANLRIKFFNGIPSITKVNNLN